MTVDPRRLHAGEWLAAAGGALLLASLFLAWFAGTGSRASVTGWQAFAAVDVVLALVGACALALAAVTAAWLGPGLPVAMTVLTAVAGSAGVLLVAVRLLDEPGPDVLLAPRAGAWVGLAGALAIVGGRARGAARRVRPGRAAGRAGAAARDAARAARRRIRRAC